MVQFRGGVPDYPVIAAQVSVDQSDVLEGVCSTGLGCLTGGVIGDLIVLFALLFASVVVGCSTFRRLFGSTGTPEPASLLGERDWPAAVTGLDGAILAENAAMQGLDHGGSLIADRLAKTGQLGEGELYRLSRQAVSAGVVLAPFGDSAEAERYLAIQLAAENRLLWQILPSSALDIPDCGGQTAFAEAPFAWLRLPGIDAPQTNPAFENAFAPAAINVLRDQIDSGVLSAGCITLPAASGGERMAIVAHRVTASDRSDTTDIILLLPCQDILDRIQSSETLEAIPVSILRLDLEGRVFWGNAQARQMLGESFESGRTLDQIAQPLGRPMDSILREVRLGRESGAGDMMRLLDARNETFVQVSLTLMTVQGQPSIMAVLTDASELRLLEDKFAQSQKMEAVGKLAGGVAHDFNNVLTAISGHCDLLLLRKDASHPDFSDLTQIRQNSNRAATLVRQLLAFSRKQTLQPRLLSVHDVVTDTLYLLDRLIGETITLHLEHGRDLGAVRADQQQLEQALMNLVVNARDAMPGGGEITIATRNKTLDEEEQRRDTPIPPGDYVEIRVTDSGTGIDPAVIDKVFDPFFTTKPQGEGTGLGLSTVYGIVKQSGGYIYAENTDAGGAAFTILLPRVQARQREVEAEPVVARPREDLTGQGVVMLVEDEAPVRSFATRALKLRGYQVIEADSAEAAMTLLEEDPQAIDVLVSDVVMPGMDGPTFAQRAREVRPDLRVIFISGYAEASFRRNLRDDDFLFLPKPFSLNDLTAKVKQAMARETSPALALVEGGDTGVAAGE